MARPSLVFVLLLSLFALFLVASATESSSNHAQDDASAMENVGVDFIESVQDDLNALAKKGKKKSGGAKKKKNMELAVQDEHTLIHGTDEERSTIYKRAKQIGATWVRHMFYFGVVHPCTPPAWIADAKMKYARLVREAQAAKLKVHMVLTGVAAGWGTYCQVSTGNPDLQSYKAHMREYVQFFGELGVRRFSVWNEPNLPTFLCAGKFAEGKDVDHGGCSASYKQNANKFLELYKAGYKIIRDLQKKNHWGKKVQILFGEYAGHTGFRMTDLMLKKAKLKADGYSWHPYQYCNPPTVKGKGKFLPGRCQRAMNGIGYVFESQKMLAKWAKSKRLTTPKGKVVPMYLTEFGYHRETKANGVPEKHRAKWYALALERARNANAKGFVLYQFYPRPQDWDTSLLNVDGSYTESFRRIHAWAKSRGYKTTAL